MSTEQNKAVIHQLMEDFWNQGKAETLDAVFAPNFVHQTAGPGIAPTREALKDVNVNIRAAFADGQSTIEDLIADGDKVAWRWTFQGRQTGPLMGIPPSDKPITMKGIIIDRLAGVKSSNAGTRPMSSACSNSLVSYHHLTRPRAAALKPSERAALRGLVILYLVPPVD